MLNQLTVERDEAKTTAEGLRERNEFLVKRLATALGKTVEQLVKEQPDVVMSEMAVEVPGSPEDQSDVSRAGSCAGSDSDSCAKKS